MRPAPRPPRAVGVYRFWRDFGFVFGALIAGLGADATSAQTAILIVALLTGASELIVAATSWRRPPVLEPATRFEEERARRPAKAGLQAVPCVEISAHVSWSG